MADEGRVPEVSSRKVVTGDGYLDSARVTPTKSRETIRWRTAPWPGTGKAVAIVNVQFIKCNFAGAMMRWCRLEGIVFEDAVFDGAVLDGSGIIGVRFVRCSMKDVSLRALMSEKNSLIDTDVEPF
jgi:hypothetical protein